MDHIPPTHGFPIANRAPASLNLKKHYSDGVIHLEQLHCMAFPLGGSEAGQMGRFSDASMFLSSSDLWKPLTAAYGKCDGLVDGKYHRARLFCFESAHFYFLCATETGDRGSMWYRSAKDKPLPLNAQSSWSRPVSYDPNDAAAPEMILFLNQVLMGMALAHRPTMDILRDAMPTIKAASEALELRASTPSSSQPAKRKAHI